MVVCCGCSNTSFAKYPLFYFTVDIVLALFVMIARRKPFKALIHVWHSELKKCLLRNRVLGVLHATWRHTEELGDELLKAFLKQISVVLWKCHNRKTIILQTCLPLECQWLCEKHSMLTELRQITRLCHFIMKDYDASYMLQIGDTSMNLSPVRHRPIFPAMINFNLLYLECTVHQNMSTTSQGNVF